MRLRFAGFPYTIRTWSWYVCQPYAPAAFTLQEIYLVLIADTGSVDPKAIARPEWISQRKIHWSHRKSNPRPSDLYRSASTNCATAYPHCTNYWSYLSLNDTTRWPVNCTGKGKETAMLCCYAHVVKQGTEQTDARNWTAKAVQVTKNYKIQWNLP
jgi:hypothetical protein